MSTPDERQRQLEELMVRALREQPLRRAPPSLESRVLAQIAQRARKRWWQSSFQDWPRGARVAFFAVSLAVTGTVLRALFVLTQPLDAAARTLDLPPEITLLQTIGTAAFVVARSMPPLWLWGGIAVLALLYAALVGIGAAAYRTVHPAR